MKYIDADLIKEEIKERIDATINIPHIPCHRREELERLLAFIDYLQQEQPEVDLEKEVKSYIKDNFTITDEAVQIPEEDRMYSMGQDDMMALVKHFYGLGLNARKRG